MSSTLQSDEALLSIFKTAIGPNERTFVPVYEAANFIKTRGLCHFSELRNVLARLGIVVHETKELPNSVSGLSQRVDGTPIILVNANMSELEREYTIAHELGHHVLHHSKGNRTLLAEIDVEPFAVTLLLLTTNDQERLRYFDEVPAAQSAFRSLQALTCATIVNSGLPEIMPVINCLAALELLEERTRETWTPEN